MSYLLYPLLALSNFLFSYVIAWPLSFVLPVFATQQMGWLDNHAKQGVGPRLPSWLSIFMTPDNSLDGDATFESINGTGYLAKSKWLRRNSAYSFALKYIGTPYDLVVSGDPTIKDNDHAKEGWCLVKANGLFQFRWVKQIGSSSICFYWNFGWNIMALADPNVNPKPDLIQATFVFSPRFSGFRP